MGLFLPKSALPGLKKYKYSSVDNSLVSKYILRPFWNQFVKIFPHWLAPNLVTLIGFFFIVINFCTALYYNPTLNQVSPSWVYASYGIGLFLYQTFDACDGLQARRTGQSSPLGQLFDHCVDAVNTTLGVLIFAAASNMGYGWPVFIAQFATLTNFYLSTWEEYHTGTLFLSMFSGPVEGILIVIGLDFIISAKGPGIFQYKILELLNIQMDDKIIEGLNGVSKVFINPIFPEFNVSQYLNDFSIMDLYMQLAGLGLLFNIVSSTKNVIASCQKKNVSYVPAILVTIPYLTYFATLTVWINLSPQIIKTWLIFPFSLGVGASVALSVGKIITAHVTDQPYPASTPLLYLPAIAISLNGLAKQFYSTSPAVGVSLEIFKQLEQQKLNHINEIFVWIIFATSISVYGCFVGDLITEITTYLDINCLTIKHPKVTSDKKEK